MFSITLLFTCLLSTGSAIRHTVTDVTMSVDQNAQLNLVDMQAEKVRWTQNLHYDNGSNLPSPQAKSKVKSSTKSGVSHVFFDFDNTISRVHVFKIIANMGGARDPRWYDSTTHAVTERGHMQSIINLNRYGRWEYNEQNARVEPVLEFDQPGERWTTAVLGGAARKKELSNLFQYLQSRGVVMWVMTKGYVGAARTLLHIEGLLPFFQRVIGNIQATGTHPQIPWTSVDKWTHSDGAVFEVREFEGAQNDYLFKGKNLLIQDHGRALGLHPSQMVLVEDDPAEVYKVAFHPMISRGLWVSDRTGMLSPHMAYLRELADGHLDETWAVLEFLVWFNYDIMSMPISP